MLSEYDLELLHDYEQWLQSWGAAPKTVKARVNLARGRLAAWGLAGFTPGNVTAFMAHRKPNGQGLSKWSKATYHANLKDFCAWLAATGHLEESPMDDPGIRKPKRPRNLPRPLTEVEVQRVLHVAHGRTRDWMVLALCTGLRAHEIAKLRGEDVSVEGIYVDGKGDAQDMLPCHPDVWAMAQNYPRHGWWFPNHKGTDHVTPDVVTIAVGRLFSSVGVEGSVHRLRHVYGTRLLRAGMNIRIVQKLMRHQNLETTALYTAVDEDELRAAVFTLPSSGDDDLPPAA